MGKNRPFYTLPKTERSRIAQLLGAIPKAVKAGETSDNDSDADDSDDDATDADSDGEDQDEEQDDSEDDDDAGDSDDDDDADDSSDSKSKTKGKFQAPKSQAELDRIIAKRIDRERKKAKSDPDLREQIREELEAEAALAAAKDAKDYQKLYEGTDKKLKAALAKIAEYEEAEELTERGRLAERVANRVGLPDGWGERLKGETETELLADAKKLKRAMPGKASAKKRSTTDEGETNRSSSRSTKRTKDGELEDWQKPGFFASDF